MRQMLKETKSFQHNGKTIPYIEVELPDIALAYELTNEILGKGKKERTLPLGNHALHYLKAYLQNTRPKLLKNTLDTEALWISNNTAKKLSDDSIAQLLKSIGKTAGLSQNLTCHIFRRTCATEMLRPAQFL